MSGAAWSHISPAVRHFQSAAFKTLHRRLHTSYMVIRTSQGVSTKCCERSPGVAADKMERLESGRQSDRNEKGIKPEK